MDFRFLQQRLLVHLRARVRNGDISERSLAHLSGLSQPHMHNVLKGARFLSMEMADQIMQRLQIELLDLAKEGAEGQDPGRQTAASRSVPFLEGAVGPGHPYPHRESRQAGYSVLASDLHGLESPVAAWLVRDPQVGEFLGRGGVILLDRSESLRINPDEESYYAVDLGEDSTVRRLELAGERLYLHSQDAGDDRGRWPSISLADRPLLEVVKGRVALMVVHL